jgi:hypothetical protein
MKPILKSILLAALFFLNFSNSNAQILAWETNGNAGNETSVNATTQNSNLQTSTLTRGSGISAAALANAFSSTNWTTAASRDDNDYYQFIVQANSGYSVSLSTLDVNFRRSGTGPVDFEWRYSLDGFSTSYSIATVNYTLSPTDGTAQSQINLTAFPDLQNVASSTTITFRLFGYSASGTTGSFAIGRLSGNDLAVGGNVFKTIYLHDFGNTTINTGTYSVAPVTFATGLSNSMWTSSSGNFIDLAGSSGVALSYSGFTIPRTMTLSFDVNPGYAININGLSFWRVRSASGPTDIELKINGDAVYAGTVPTTGANTTFQTVTGKNNLNGTVTVELILTNSSGGNFRLDDFMLAGDAFQTITTGTPSTGFPLSLNDCATATNGSIGFTTHVASMNAGNVYSVQLSDASGSFATPVTIGSLTSTALSGTVNYTIPAGLKSGNYKMRIASSNPAYLGTQTANLTITQNGSCAVAVTGDYMTRATGNWNQNTTWKKFTGIIWEDCASGDFPDNTDVSTFVLNTHTITVPNSLYKIKNLTIDNGGKVYRNNTSATQIVYLSLYGNIICNGEIGNGTTNDAIAFHIQQGSHTISGSGTFNAFRIRNSNETPNIGSSSLTIDMNINLRWDASTGGTNAIYNNYSNAASNFDVTVNANKTLTITNTAASFGMDGSASGVYPAPNHGGAYHVYGKIACAGSYIMGSNNTAANRPKLHIYNGGVVETAKIDFGTSNATDGHELIIENGGTLKITGSPAWSNTSSGSNIFTLSGGSIIEYSGNVAQNVTNIFDYQNLYFSGTGTKSLIGNTTVKGEVSFNDLAGNPVLNGGSHILTVEGGWETYGTNGFNAQTGKVILKGSNKTVTGANNFNTLQIDGTISFSSGSQNVYDRVELKSGTLTTGGRLVLKSTQTKTGFINDFTSGMGGNISGNITIERYVPLAVNNGAQYPYMNRYHYLGAITGGTASKWSSQFAFNATSGIVDGVTTVTPRPGCDREYLETGSAFSNLFSYNESKVSTCYLEGWEPRTTAASTPRGKGFAARINDPSIINGNRILSETGTYSNTAPSPLNLSINHTIVPSTYDSRGEHLVANPYWAPIDWTVVATAAGNSNLDATAYRYNPATGTYLASNSTGFNPPIISTNEAFVVKPANNNIAGPYTLNFPPNARVTSDNNHFLRQQPPYDYALTIKVSANDEADEAYIAFGNDFTEQYDNGYDARKITSSLGVPSIYTRDAAQEKNAILAISEAMQTNIIPLGVQIEYNGTHEMEFNGMNDFPVTAIVWLEDLQTGTIQYLRQNNIYTFTANKTDHADRFLLHFAPEMLIAVTAADCEQQNGSISITEIGGLNWSYELKDDNNQTVSQNNSFSGTQIHITNLSKGIYTLHLHHALSGYSTAINLSITGLQPVTAAISTTATHVMVNEVFTAEAQATGATQYDWQMGDGTAYVNQQNVTHSYQVPGIYEVTLTAGNDDCSTTATQNITVDLSTGITDNRENNINIYASKNTIYISKHNNETEKATINLFNTLGQKMIETQTTTLSNTPQTIEMNIAAGIYYVSVQTEREHKMIVRKVMLEENK